MAGTSAEAMLSKVQFQNSESFGVHFSYEFEYLLPLDKKIRNIISQLNEKKWVVNNVRKIDTQKLSSQKNLHDQSNVNPLYIFSLAKDRCKKNMGWQNVSSDKTRLTLFCLFKEKMSERNIHEHRNRTRIDNKWSSAQLRNKKEIWNYGRLIEIWSFNIYWKEYNNWFYKKS